MRHTVPTLMATAIRYYYNYRTNVKREMIISLSILATVKLMFIGRVLQYEDVLCNAVLFSKCTVYIVFNCTHYLKLCTLIGHINQMDNPQKPDMFMTRYSCHSRLLDVSLTFNFFIENSYFYLVFPKFNVARVFS